MRAYSALLAVLGYMGSLTQWQRLVGPLISWGWAGRPPTPCLAGGGCLPGLEPHPNLSHPQFLS